MDCEYGDPDDMLFDAIIEGVKETWIREWLLDKEEELMLAKAIEIHQQYEMSEQQMRIVCKGWGRLKSTYRIQWNKTHNAEETGWRQTES